MYLFTITVQIGKMPFFLFRTSIPERLKLFAKATSWPRVSLDFPLCTIWCSVLSPAPNVTTIRLKYTHEKKRTVPITVSHKLLGSDPITWQSVLSFSVWALCSSLSVSTQPSLQLVRTVVLFCGWNWKAMPRMCMDCEYEKSKKSHYLHHLAHSFYPAF
jgi:hypothetical protein